MGKPVTAVDRLGRLFVFVVLVLLWVAVGYLVFVVAPGTLAELLGVLVVVLSVPLALRVAGNVAGSLFPDYNVAEVSVEGPIVRSAGGSVPPSAVPTGVDAAVEQMERADEDGAVEALVVKVNSPGGEIVPSEDLRIAAERFDGPVVAYATDVCASGGYVVACGCDELWAREGSIVGSIGVRGSRFTVDDLLDSVGVDYEQFTAGEYKEAGVPFTDLDDDERAYLQGIIDDYYEDFVETVVENRDLDAEAVRETEARVYLGEAAHELGLVDALGTREDVLDRVEELTGEEPSVRAFEPQAGLFSRIRATTTGMAYAAGRGAADAVAGDGEVRFRR